ncbi:MAG: hypothetical protein KGL95_07400 [Patescibacteria group bacterium]|nr:hypothetical protein [Patescibacteria group bacterium]
MKIQNNKTKIATTIIASLITGLVLLSSMTVLPNVNAQTTPFVAPAMPNAVGCYHYQTTTGWQNTACLSADELKKVRHPNEGANYGVYGESASGTQSLGETDVKFATYSGETDNKTNTSNTWSIQTNTNQWLVSGITYQVQFTEQNLPGVSSNEVACVWQIKVAPKPQDYSDKQCVSVPQQTLSSSFEGYVQGTVQSGDNLQTEYCNPSISQCYGVIVADHHNLNTHWTQTSGTILGEGSSSQAVFVSPTSETTNVLTGPATSVSTITDKSTQETNNLSYGTPSTPSCSSNICTLTVTSTN